MLRYKSVSLIDLVMKSYIILAMYMYTHCPSYLYLRMFLIFNKELLITYFTCQFKKFNPHSLCTFKCFIFNKCVLTIQYSACRSTKSLCLHVDYFIENKSVSKSWVSLSCLKLYMQCFTLYFKINLIIFRLHNEQNLTNYRKLNYCGIEFLF